MNLLNVELRFTQECIGAAFDLPLFSARERLALEYAEAVTDGSVTDALSHRVKAQFGEDALVELTGLAAFQNMSAKFNAALGMIRANKLTASICIAAVAPVREKVCVLYLSPPAKKARPKAAATATMSRLMPEAGRKNE